MFHIKDMDGTVTGRNVPTLIGSHVDWWRIDDTCVRNPDWGVWVCDLKDRQIAHIYMLIPGITRTAAEEGQAVSHTQIGAMRFFGDTDFSRSMVLTKNPGWTGWGNTAWEMVLAAGSPKAFQIDTMQIPRGSFLVLAVPYPSGTTFTIRAKFPWDWPQPTFINIPQVRNQQTKRSREDRSKPPEKGKRRGKKKREEKGWTAVGPSRK